MSMTMRRTILRSTVVAAATVLAAAISTLPAQALDAKWCKDVHIRFFVGGAEGDAFGTIVYNGAKQAEDDLGPKVDYIFSQWDIEKMVQQLREAVAVKPNGIAAALVTGMLLGFLVGSLVVYGGLSSLIATLGMNFLLRGLIQIINEGKSMALTSLSDSWAYTIFSSQVLGIPVQIFWAIGFVVLSAMLYNRHRFGAQVRVVGDNPDSAQQMGIDVKRVRVKVFVFVGIGAAIAGTFSVMINFTWWPTAGDGYLLPVLASVFVGGTPTWGGIGTVVGGAIGAVTVSFIQTGVVAAGLSGFYVQFFNGLIIILSLLGHKWNQARYR